MKVPSRVKKLMIQLFWALISLTLIFLIVSIETKEQDLVGGQQTSNKAPQELDSLDGKEVYVARVSDGDTLWISAQGREYKVRMVGIDSSELQGEGGSPECYAQDAEERLRSLVGGEIVVFTFDETQDRQDIYQRLLGYLALEGEDVGEQLVRGGYAREFTYRKAYEKQSIYREAEVEAKREERGIWSCS